MPTNVLRKKNAGAGDGCKSPAVRGNAGQIAIKIGPVSVSATLMGTDTARRVFAALPFFGIAETWGHVIHSEMPMKAGRDRTAKINAQLGELYFWPDEGRILLPFGPSPISRPNEIRLPCPCNVIGSLDVDEKIRAALRTIQPASKMTIVQG